MAPDENRSTVRPEVVSHYESVREADRLDSGPGVVELARTRELVLRHAPSPPAVVLDVGGAAGVYACWLATRGYEVHLVDPVARHVRQAARASEAQPGHPLASVSEGDARGLAAADTSVDVVLALGPLYHLTEAGDRARALAEANRVLRPGGTFFGAAISRFASALDGMARELLADPAFVEIVDRDLMEGQHRNPTDHPDYFTTAYFHRPEELAAEVEASGLVLEGVFAIEGPTWLVPTIERQWQDPARRKILMETLRRLETEPALLGASAHLLAVARKPA